jgi:Tol biopolymer transport system component
MSPEQASGQPVDRRTDIWSFGCCLYEALAGRRAFAGKTISDTLAAVLDREPDWSALPGATPDSVARLLRWCLTRDLRRRLQHVGDARLELEEAGAGVVEGRKPGRRLLGASRWAMSGALVGALATGVGFWLAGRAPGGPPLMKPPSVTRLTLELDSEDAPGLRLTVAGRFVPFALSPDGTRLVIHAHGLRGQQLFLREMSGFDTKPLPGTEGASDPFWSPDGRWVGFWRSEDHELWKVSVAGGPPIRIAPTGIPTHALWGEDGEILLDTGRLWSIPAAGGEPRPIPIHVQSDEEWIGLQGRIPGRSDLLVASARGEETWLEVLSPRTGERRRLLRGGRTVMARFTPSGHLVYADDDALFAVPMDMERLEPFGGPVPVMNGIDHYYYHSNVSLSDAGTVVYLPSERVRPAELVWIDRAGRASPVPHVDSFEPQGVSLSPDGRTAAVAVTDGGRSSVWILDLERGSKRLLAPGAMGPVYGRDGVFVTYVSFHGEQFVFSRRRADGTGEEERLFTHTSGWADTLDWSPDGRSLLLRSYSNSRDADVWIHSDGKTAPLLAGPANEWSATFSPDGRFVAFDTDEGGEDSVYLQPFPGPGPRTVVSIGGGGGPRWGHDGRLFYWSGTGQGQRMMAVDVKTAPVLRVGRPQALFETDRRWPIYDVDVTADGRFLALLPRETVGGPLELRVVLNWFEELERLAPHPRR